MKKIFYLLTFILFIYTASAYSFGQNKVQYKDFDWKILKTQHFDLYFYSGEEELVRVAADMIEKANTKLERDFAHQLSARIPVIIYASHNDFQQTNIILEIIGEGTGGFTELMRNRVAVPFTGSYSDFEHVLTHELVHVFTFDIVYGGPMEAVSASLRFFDMPLWFSEGLAEYFSIQWDSESEMWLRDLVISQKFVPLPILSYYGGYIVYKEGQSFFRYIDKYYGTKKIASLVQTVAHTKNVEVAIELVFAKKLEEISKEWEMELKKEYWPQIATKEHPTDFAKRITNHTKDGSFFNTAPALSHDGKHLAYISDNDDYMSVYLVSFPKGKVIRRLIKGESSGKFEGMHILRTKLSWSPDDLITFSAKAGKNDNIYIIDTKGHIKKRYSFDFDGLFTPEWSPDGTKIVFSAIKNGKSDIYLINVDKDKLNSPTTPIQLTDDTFDDIDPTFSPDGKYIIFSSDRNSKPKSTNEFKYLPPYGQYDIFKMDLETRTITAITSDIYKDTSPTISPDGSKMVFVSDRNGSPNLYVMNLESPLSPLNKGGIEGGILNKGGIEGGILNKGDNTSITPPSIREDKGGIDSLLQMTNLTGGCYDPHWSKDGKMLVFSSYTDVGKDIYYLKNPLSHTYKIKYEQIVPQSSTLQKQVDTTEISRDSTKFAVSDTVKPKGTMTMANPILSVPYSDTTKTSADSTKEEITEYKEEKFKLKFAPDLVSGGLIYSSAYGTYGGLQLAFSDILGNHRIFIASDFASSTDDTNIETIYYYLPRRTDYILDVYHYKYLYYTYDIAGIWYFTERMYGGGVFLSYPLNMFQRIDIGLSARGLEREYLAVETWDGKLYYDLGIPKDRLFFTFPTLGFVTDNVIWGVTGPVNGFRADVEVGGTSKKLASDVNFTYGFLDARKYFRIKKNYNFAFRLASEGIFTKKGEEFQYFYIGGGETIRGYEDYQFRGTKFAFLNSEFRFPFIETMRIAWPISMVLTTRGAIFMDIGGVWNDTAKFRAFSKNYRNELQLEDLLCSYGLGARVRLAYFVLKFDWAWNINPKRTSDYASETKRPKFHFGIGAEY